MRWLVAAIAVGLTLATASYAVVPPTTILSTGYWLIKEQRKIYQIDVEALAPTLEAARTEGFRLAVDQAVGSLLLAETQVSNGELHRRDIVVYASGFVENFVVLTQENTSSGVKITMRVWVSHSQIADRLFAKSETSGEIDGNRAVAQLSTVNAERINGDRAVELVLRDFPARAFDVAIGGTNFTYDAYRRSALEIPFVLQWNYAYLTSLHEVLQRTSQNPEGRNCWGFSRECGGATFIRVISPPGGPKWNNTVGFNDFGKYGLVNAELIESRPKLFLTLRNNMGSVVAQLCYNMPELDHVIQYNVPTTYMVDITPKQISINGNKVIQSKIVVNLGQNYQSLGILSQAELRVVRESQCPK